MPRRGFGALDRRTGIRCAVAVAATVAVHLAIVLALRAGPSPFLSAEPTYYAIAALDRAPAPLASPADCYPHGASGEVTYELLIDESGAVDRVAVLSVKPEGLFTGAAAELCARLRFSPAMKDGRAVKSRVRFVVAPG